MWLTTTPHVGCVSIVKQMHYYNIIVGFKLVIPRPLGPHGIYCLCPRAQAINPIQPSWAWYNYNLSVWYLSILCIVIIIVILICATSAKSSVKPHYTFIIPLCNTLQIFLGTSLRLLFYLLQFIYSSLCSTDMVFGKLP